MTVVNTRFSLLDEMASRMEEYPADDAQAADKAWRDLAVALTVLLVTLDKTDVAEGVVETFDVADRLANKLTQLDRVING